MIHLKTNSKSQLACSHKGTERGSFLPLHQTGKFWAGLFHHTQVCLTTTLLWFTLVRGKTARKVSPSQEMSIKPGKKQGYHFMWLSFSKASGHMARAEHLRTFPTLPPCPNCRDPPRFPFTDPLFSRQETDSYIPKDRCWPNDLSQPGSFSQIAEHLQGQADGSPFVAAHRQALLDRLMQGRFKHCYLQAQLKIFTEQHIAEKQGKSLLEIRCPLSFVWSQEHLRQEGILRRQGKSQFIPPQGPLADWELLK